MKTIIGETSQILMQAADQITDYISAHPKAKLALGANDDCLMLYRELSSRCALGTLDLSCVCFFAVTEFDGITADDPNSCRSRLRETLLDAVDPHGERTAFLRSENEEAYDVIIAEAGGLDLAILGIGQRGRVGFNEPGTPFDSVTHRQKLTKATKRELSGLFGGEEQVPAFGLTMGIHTILGAKEILVFASGEEKADPVFRMLYARDDSFVPAAFLQLPLQVTVYVDEAAAAKL